MIAILYNTSKTKDIVIASDSLEPEPQVEDIVTRLNHSFNTYFTLLINNNEKIKNINPELSSKKIINNTSTIYICENFSCKEPITDLNKAYSDIIGD